MCIRDSPETGLTQPGMTIVCGDSHTSTHGAMGCVAFGIGTSEVEMVLASQCVLQSKPKTMRINVEGPVSYTHLDVYKRQALYDYRNRLNHILVRHEQGA